MKTYPHVPGPPFSVPQPGSICYPLLIVRVVVLLIVLCVVLALLSAGYDTHFAIGVITLAGLLAAKLANWLTSPGRSGRLIGRRP
jgi:hypothetical protein